MEILQSRLDNIKVEKEEDVKKYYDIRQQLEQCERDFRDVITVPRLCIQFLQPGRLVKIKIPLTADDKAAASTSTAFTGLEDELDFGWGVLINYQNTLKVRGSDPFTNAAEGTVYMLDVALVCASGTEMYGKQPRPCPVGDKGEVVIVPCALSCVESFSSVKVFLPKEIKSTDGKNHVQRVLNEVKRRFDGNVPRLDPVEDMGIKDAEFLKLIKVSRRSDRAILFLFIEITPTFSLSFLSENPIP